TGDPISDRGDPDLPTRDSRGTSSGRIPGCFDDVVALLHLRQESGESRRVVGEIAVHVEDVVVAGGRRVTRSGATGATVSLIFRVREDLEALHAFRKAGEDVGR